MNTTKPIRRKVAQSEWMGLGVNSQWWVKLSCGHEQYISVPHFKVPKSAICKMCSGIKPLA